MIAILVLTKELDAVRALNGDLEQAGYRVVGAGDGQASLGILEREQPDLLMLDLALPGLDGLAMCQRLRQASDVPILVLTDQVEEAERVVAQESCAVDFVLKPASSRQVLARIQTLLRRAKRRGTMNADPENGGIIRAGDLALNLAHHRAIVAGEPVELTRTELELLATLASEPGRVFSRSHLVSALNNDRTISERTIDTFIKNLRAKIEHDPSHPRYVLTVYGVGYKLSEGRGA